MLPQLRSRLTYANVMASIAVFLALGGTATAALVITSKNVKNNSLTSADIKNRSLLSQDFKPGQLVAGAPGPQGPQGPKGDAGAPGAKGDAGAPGAKGDPCPSTDPACRGPQGEQGDPGPSNLIASSVSGQTTTINSTCTNYLNGEVTITVPGPGKIAVDASTNVKLSHTSGTTDYLQLMIGTSTTDCADQYGAYHRVPAGLPTETSSDRYQLNQPVMRVFTVAAAGTYTYYLNGRMNSGQDSGDVFFWNRMTATYFPE